MIGPWQIFLILLVIIVPVGLYFLGYRAGKKAGYLQRMKETDKTKIES